MLVTTIMSYSDHFSTIPQPYYPSSPYDQVSQRSDNSQRKRPKYTRSKTGCLTCRTKKIKCDETKPSCMRCTHGSRECTWPEGGVPVRKKGTARNRLDGRPSTAGSSGLSDASTPPTREHTPPKLEKFSPLPSESRSSSDNFIHLHPVSSEHASTLRQPERGSGYMSESNPNILSIIPESHSSRYDTYSLHHPHSSQSSRHTMSGSYYRTLSHEPTSHWNSSTEELNFYYHGRDERTMPGHGPQYDHSNNRYQ